MKNIPNVEPTSRSLAVAKGDMLVVADMEGHAEWFAVNDLRGGRLSRDGKSVDYEEMALLRLNAQPDSMAGGVSDGD